MSKMITDLRLKGFYNVIEYYIDDKMIELFVKYDIYIKLRPRLLF